MFVRMSGASEGRGAIRGKARGPAVGAKRRLPGPGKTKVTSAAGLRLSPRSGRQARPGGVEGAPAGRTGAGVNRPTGRPRNAAPVGDCNREGGRGNTEAAAVHKAGKERRFGATPATATPLPYSSRRSGDSVLIFRFGHTRRCPRLRALRVSGLAGTATPNAMGVLTFRFGDKKSRPRLRPLRSPELAGTARMSGWLVLTFRFGHTRRCPCLRPLRTPGLAGTAPPIAFRDRSPTDGRSLALAASGREWRSI